MLHNKNWTYEKDFTLSLIFVHFFHTGTFATMEKSKWPFPENSLLSPINSCNLSCYYSNCKFFNFLVFSSQNLGLSAKSFSLHPMDSCGTMIWFIYHGLLLNYILICQNIKLVQQNVEDKNFLAA